MPDYIDDLCHIIVKCAGAGIIALVATNAGFDIEIVRINDPECLVVFLCRHFHPGCKDAAVATGPGTSLKNQHVHWGTDNSLSF